MTVGLLGCEGVDYEIDSTGQALNSQLESTYMGPCIEDLDSTFTRNDGLEECTVVAMEEIDDPLLGLMCFQTLDCEPVGTLVGPSGNPLPPNEVCNHAYIPGPPLFCQAKVQTDYEACEAVYQAAIDNGEYPENAEFAYQDCMDEASAAFELCMEDHSQPHYDCDDFVLDYPNQYICEDTCGFSGLGCNGHAQSVVQQGPPGDDGTCLYAVVEPQAPSGDGSDEVVFYFRAPCSAQPIPPQDVLDQRGLTDCSTWIGSIHDPLAGEDPHYDYPDAPVHEEAPAPIDEEAPA